ncbi:DNA polymerase III subunit delta' [Leucobacter sp. HY1908]
MDFWSDIAGQQAAAQTLERAAAEGATPAHAWLITGPPGSGRSNIAYRFAAALIARSEADRERVYAQVLARTHPDLGVLTTQTTVIKIDAAREVVASSYYAPSEGRYRVFVIEDADRMTEHTSNVLLKALEEPPERTVWVLCAPSEADLLPTIRSRTRSLRLVTPAVTDVAALLHARDGIDLADAERAARLAQSHIGMARSLARDPNALERRERVIRGALSVQTLGDAMAVAGSLMKVAEADAAATTERRETAEREDAMRSLGLAQGAAIPPQMRSQIRALEEDQKQRAKRGVRDGVDRILTDVLSLYRDVVVTALMHEGASGAGAVGEGAAGAVRAASPALVNAEYARQITELAERWRAKGALRAVDAVESARERLGRQITPGLVLEALFATAVGAGSER